MEKREADTKRGRESGEEGGKVLKGILSTRLKNERVDKVHSFVL